MSAKQIWLNGRLLAADGPHINAYDHGLLYGDGVFEGIRIYGGRIFKAKAHLDRLYDGAAAIELKIPYAAADLARAMTETVAANGLTNGYIRLCVTRGAGTLGLNPFQCPKASVFIIADTLTLYPAELYESGMAIITAKTLRNHPRSLNPAVKSLNYLNNILAKIEAVKAGVSEALMLNDRGEVAECTGDNVFIVQKQTLRTPPLSAGILSGITRNLVLTLAKKAGIAVSEEPFDLKTLYAADEMFLTGTAAEVIPVTRVDTQNIGPGRSGPLTARLIADFRRYIADWPDDAN